MSKIERGWISRADRHRDQQDITIRSKGWSTEATMCDLSRSGFLAFTLRRLGVGNEISVGISGIGRRNAIVVRVEEAYVACQFTALLDEGQVIAAREAKTVDIWTIISSDTNKEPLLIDNRIMKLERSVALHCEVLTRICELIKKIAH